jgi:uncharacterized protein (TIGR03435 family)
MIRMTLSMGLVAFWLCPAFGQSDAGRPVFEVVSIKPGNPDSRLLRTVISSGGRLNADNVSLRTLIEDAYQLKPFQLAGGPRWMDGDKFEVIAKAAQSASDAQIRLMLQSLLAERFQLTMHRETKEQTFSILMVKGQPKIEPAKEGEKFRMMTSTTGRGALSNHVAFKSASMARLADILARQMEHMVEDQTGLTGEFDFELEATRDESEPNPFIVALAPAIGQLGLKLESRKGPVEFFVVDRAEKPSGN